MSNKDYKQLDDTIKQYLFLKETITDYEITSNRLGNKIVYLLEAFNTNKRGNVRLSSKSALKTIDVRTLKTIFDGDLLDSLIINIDIEKSLDALKYETNLPEPIVKAFEEKLNTLKELDVPILVIESGDD